MVQVPSSLRQVGHGTDQYVPATAAEVKAAAGECDSREQKHWPPPMSTASEPAAAAAVGGGRRSMDLWASFATWDRTNTAPAGAGSSSVNSSGSNVRRNGPALLRLGPRGLDDEGGDADADDGSGYNGGIAQGIEAAAVVADAPPVYRASDGGMFARGSVIQPSPKLFGLMAIHDRGSTAG